MSEQTAGSTPDTLPQLVREAIQSIISYLWEDELDDICEQYQAGSFDDPADSGHMFAKLVTVDNWLNGTTHAVDDLMADHVDEPVLGPYRPSFELGGEG